VTAISFDTLSFLVVEDSAHMRTILRTILMGFGTRKIYEAEDGADGLEKLEAYGPDIVIVDWEMPVLNGPEMIRFIRNPDGFRHAFVPIILLTAHTERRRIVQSRSFGVNEVLRKPVSPKAIYQRVASIVLNPRPFLRTDTYFGPEPRDEMRPAARAPVNMTDARETEDERGKEAFI
jgi:CheY-like chemotaxis protein